MDASITMDDLFQVRQETEIGGKKVSVRALSDLERQLASRKALEESAKKEKELKTDGSPDNLAAFATLDRGEDDTLKASLAIYKQNDAWREAIDKVQPEFIPFPDKATDEERRSVMLRRDEEIKRSTEARKTYVDKYIEKYKKSIDKLTHDQLVEEIRKQTIRLAVDLAYNETYELECLLVSVERNKDGLYVPYFRNRNEVSKVPDKVRAKLLETLRVVNGIDPLALNGQLLTESQQESTL